MWIIPKSLHTSAYVPDTAALISDLNELSEQLERSLIVRSKATLARTWLKKLKTDTWTQRLYGRILKPSRGEHFASAWTYSAEAFLASHLAPPGDEQETATPATSGPILCEGSESWADLPLFSSKMSREYLAQASAVQGGATPPARPFCAMSSASWSAWVIERRRGYLARLKLAPRTNASGYLYSGSEQTSAQTDTRELESCWRPPTAQESGQEENLTDKAGLPWRGEGRAYRADGTFKSMTLNLQVYAEARQWGTPRVGLAEAGKSQRPSQQSKLENQVQEQTWPTPTTAEHPMKNQIVTAGGRRLAKGQTTRSYGFKLGEAVVFCPTTHIDQGGTWPTPTRQETPHYEMTLTATGRREGRGEGAASHSMNLCDAARTDPTTAAYYAALIADPATPERLRRKLAHSSQRWQTPSTEETTRGSNNPLDIGQLRICNDPLLRVGAHGPQDEAPDSTRGSPRASHPESREILNPRWVEVLMGLPVGWVMATCGAPWTPEPMSLDYSETELYPPQQSERLGCYGES